MNDPRLHELLSAYLDGEATPGERAEVEAWLEQGDEARAEWREIERVGDLLRDAVADPAGVDLRAAVLTAITESAPPHASAPEPVASRPAAVPSPRSHWAAIAGLVASVACVFVVALVLGPERGTAPSMTEADSVDRGPNVIAPSDPPSVAARDAGLGSGDVLTAPEKRGDELDDVARLQGLEVAPTVRPPVPAADADPHGTPPDPAPGHAVAEVESVEGEPRLFVLEERDLEQAKPFVEAREAAVADLRVGDVVPFVDRSGDRIAVVEVTVVDVQQAFGAVQLLLQRNEIHEFAEADLEEEPATGDAPTLRRTRIRRGASGAARVLEQLEKQRRSNARPDDTFAVYVTSTPTRLASTLEALRRHESVVSLKSPDGTAVIERFRTAPGAADGPTDRRVAANKLAAPADQPPGEGKPERTGADSKRTEIAGGAGGTVPAEQRDTYQVLRKYAAVETRRQLAEADKLRPDPVDAIRPDAAKRIESRTIDDESVRVLILLRPAGDR